MIQYSSKLINSEMQIQNIFCIADIKVDCDLLQLQQRLLLPYLWETTDAWSLRQLQFKCSRCETAFSFPRWLVGLVTPYISDEPVGGDCSRPQSVELRQAASSQIVHLNIK